jgi:hypothetical protein
LSIHFRVRPESARLMQSLNASVSPAKRKRPGSVQIGEPGWPGLVRQWLDTDLSDTATALAMGESLRKYAMQ